MPRRFPLTAFRPIGEINMTPLMDLTFLLLITFIITFPLIEQGIPVNLPKASAERVSPDTARTLTIDRTGKVFLDDHAVEIADLEAALVRIRDLAPDVTVLVRADQELAYKHVVKVLKALHGAHITQTALVTEAE